MKIILCVLGAMLIVVAILVVWQWDNITALRYTLTMSSQTMEENIVKNNEQVKTVMDEYQIKEKVFSKSELDAMANDDAAVDKAAEEIAKNQKPPAAPPKKPANTAKPKSDTVDYTDEIRVQLAKMSVLRASYSSQLEGIVASAKAEYMSLPPEKHTDANKQAVVMNHVGALSSLESSCDRKAGAVISELRRLLKASGKSSSVADSVESAYANEKNLKKAYYISKFGG
ncbi:MAG: hypothetical protein RSC43_07085 [Clostridia bacterium]